MSRRVPSARAWKMRSACGPDRLTYNHLVVCLHSRDDVGNPVHRRTTVSGAAGRTPRAPRPSAPRTTSLHSSSSARVIGRAGHASVRLRASTRRHSSSTGTSRYRSSTGDAQAARQGEQLVALGARPDAELEHDRHAEPEQVGGERRGSAPRAGRGTAGRTGRRRGRPSTRRRRAGPPAATPRARGRASSCPPPATRRSPPGAPTSSWSSPLRREHGRDVGALDHAAELVARQRRPSRRASGPSIGRRSASHGENEPKSARSSVRSWRPVHRISSACTAPKRPEPSISAMRAGVSSACGRWIVGQRAVGVEHLRRQVGEHREQRVVERVGPARVAEHRPPHREPAAAVEEIGAPGHRALRNPVERRRRRDQVEARRAAARRSRTRRRSRSARGSGSFVRRRSREPGAELDRGDACRRGRAARPSPGRSRGRSRGRASAVAARRARSGARRRGRGTRAGRRRSRRRRRRTWRGARGGARTRRPRPRLRRG